MSKSGEYKAVWLRSNSAGKNIEQVRSLIEGFLKSNKLGLVVRFETPETLELQAEVTELKRKLRQEYGGMLDEQEQLKAELAQAKAECLERDYQLAQARALLAVRTEALEGVKRYANEEYRPGEKGFQFYIAANNVLTSTGTEELAAIREAMAAMITGGDAELDWALAALKKYF